VGAVAIAVAAAVPALFAATASAEGPVRLLKAQQDEPRKGAISAPLPNGEVLIAGGENATGPVATAELYNPATESFEPLTARMTTARFLAAAAPLPGGKVLIFGGRASLAPSAALFSSAELYNPETKSFESITATEVVPRYAARAITLANGNVLIVGGGSTNFPVEAEIFNSEKNQFERGGTELVDRGFYPAAIRYAPGKVLIAVGEGKVSVNGVERQEPLSSTELFNEATGRFEALPGKPTLVEGREGVVGCSFPAGGTYIAGGWHEHYLSLVEEFYRGNRGPSPARARLSAHRWEPPLGASHHCTFRAGRTRGR